MLPASQTPRSQFQRSSLSSQWQIALVVVLTLYTFAVGVGLLTNAVRPERAYLLFAIPCLLPAAWCAVGFWRSEDGNESDSGLLLSAAGWALIGLAFLFKHIAVSRAGADAYASDASTPLTLICATVGVLLLIAGAALSWSFWSRNFD